MNGIILAAGLGKRLKPITDFIPKPLLPIVHTPVIQLNIEKLRRAGIKHIGINLYYKAKEIKEFLKKFKNLKIIIEDVLLGTGGALINLKDFLGDDFLIHNCDVVSNINLKRVIKEHKRKKTLATIVLVKNKKTNRVKIGNQRIVKFYKKKCKGCFTYAGIAVLAKRIFDYFPENKKNFSLVEVYNNALKNGEVLIGLIVKDAWYDIGTSAVYRKLNAGVLKKRIKIKGIRL